MAESHSAEFDSVVVFSTLALQDSEASALSSASQYTRKYSVARDLDCAYVNLSGAHPHYIAWEGFLRRGRYDGFTVLFSQARYQSPLHILLALMSLSMGLPSPKLHEMLMVNMTLSGYSRLAARLLCFEKKLQPLHMQLLVDFLPEVFATGLMATHWKRQSHAFMFTSFAAPVLVPPVYQPCTPCVHVNGNNNDVVSLVLWGPVMIC